MSATSIRVSEELSNASKAESRLMHRSQAGQIEYWARIGRAIEQSGQFDYQHIARALKAEIPVDDLSAYEKPVFDAMHDEAMRDANTDEVRTHERRMNVFRDNGVDVDTLGD
ncbi:hypothetical protein SSPSH_001497 [Salinisphaera shabanensis E1L3A]|uniref:ParD-like antitoxin of type II toxin-antitoxin system n=1 Tax=Salinisphaera shabanensis E1L3A TaxID=1033802 RepID=U2FTY8_9GAMM|nr:hypothetical protein [Salinisphaera shabanensis]ERJ19429.1 hypothetical protein SSPSH_001497 [Salinisphaera shabanensis E1L3A]